MPSMRAVGAALSLIVIFLAVLSIPLSVGTELELTGAEMTGWIMALYGAPGVLSLILIARYRQPLLVTGNVFILIFVSSLGTDLAWPELVGASMLAGAVVLVLGPLGLTDRLAAWLPAPIVFGLLAGAVLPFVVDLFGALGEARLVVGGTLGAYVAGRLLDDHRLPAILPALVVGLLLTAVTGGFGSAADVSFPAPVLTAPQFSWSAILTATPVMVVLITLQANVPSVVFLRSQGYEPPERTVTTISGVGTLAGSLLGPFGVSLSLPATALVAGPDAGEPAGRHRAAVIASVAAVAVAALAGFAAMLSTVVPHALLAGVVGLAVLGVLTGALERIATGPLRLGPVFAFAIALSDLSLFGLGPFFWALAIGLAVSLLLERDEWRKLRAGDQ